LDRAEERRVDLFLPLEAGDVFPLEALQDLRGKAGQAVSMSACRGTVHLKPGRIFGRVQWRLEGAGKDFVLQLADSHPSAGFYVNESDYSGIREHVKIQLLGVWQGQKTFNILEIF